MPTKHSRISVTVDPALRDALSRARAAQPKRVPDATLIRDLAVRGAGALGNEVERRRELLCELADAQLGGLDLATLARVRHEDERVIEL